MAKGSFGEILKRERELREVTLNEVTVATRIAPRFLEAFEREDWEKLPGGVFNRGFVRAIARYLGLNEENLLSEYDLAYGEQNPVSSPLEENPIPSPPKWAVAVGMFAVLLLCVGLISASVYGWHRYAAYRSAKRAGLSTSAAVATQPGAEAPTSALKSSSAPVKPPTPAPGPSAGAPAAPQRLDLSISTSAVTRVRVVGDGRILLDARLPAGETRRLFARNQFVVSASQPSAVLLELNGQAMPQLGSNGASGTMVLSQKDVRQAPSGNSQP